VNRVEIRLGVSKRDFKNARTQSDKKNDLEHTGAMGIFIGVLLIALFHLHTSRPIVFVDSLSGDCAAVEFSDGLRDCSYVPSDADEIPVAPGMTFAKLSKH